jgi:two-component system, response regulator YesN
MVRLLVADDERPVVESISHIVRRELAADFEVVGAASSGREAVELAMSLSPDIVLMDVRMPGLSGLDAIREMRRLGSRAAVVLITAYERFDIAREAVELGVVDYLLKPVSKDSLAESLRGAAGAIERRGELERREIEHRELEEEMRILAEIAFLQGIMLGERSPAAMERYRSALGVAESSALMAAVSILPSAGARDPESESAAIYEALRSTLRYKTRAIAGPRVSGMIAVFLPVRDAREGSAAAEDLRAAIEAAHAKDIARGRLRLGFGGVRPFTQLPSSWSEAVADLLDPGRTGLAPATDGDLEAEDAFLAALAIPSPERAALALERILGPLRARSELRAAERLRVAILFGKAADELRRRGAMSSAEAAAAQDLGDVFSAPGGAALDLALRPRFAALAEAAARGPRRSTPLDAAVAKVKTDFAKPLTLESVAAEIGISAGRLSRLFVEGTGKGFSDYLIERRIERAKELLLEPGAAIKQVSAACGYPDQNYFSRLFKKVTGFTPTGYFSGTTEAKDEAN